MTVLAMLALCLAGFALPGPARAAGDDEISLVSPRATAGTTERIVIDPTTGLALNGFDPVSYFIDREPKPGLADFEIVYQGAYWRFANEGNLAAFKANPSVYVPRFGGYGALAVARGSPAPGNPAVWAIHDRRLYLFYSPAARTVWLMQPQAFVRDGEARWPELESTLAR